MAAERRSIAWVRFLAVLLLLGSAGAGLGLAFVHRTLEEPFQAFSGPEIVVTVPSGTSVRESLDLMEREGVLANQLLATLYWRFVLKDPVLIAGEYRFRGPASTPEVLNKIARGEVVMHPVTILEGLTLVEIARHLANQGFGTYEAFLSEMATPRLIQDFDQSATNLEGYLFPDTYAFSRDTSETRVVEALVAGFHEHFQEAQAMVSAANSDGDSSAGLMMTRREIVTLASIVEKEALLDEERPIIAGVYANRLRRGMGLYADPTIIYALKRQEKWDGNLRRRDLDLDSPYNTYRTVGLPPGPICSPGLASLAAAMAPAEVPYLYFVSRNDGTHVFARTLTEHNRNVHQWQKLYWRQRWSGKREGEKLH